MGRPARGAVSFACVTSLLLLGGCKGAYGPTETCETLAKQQCRFLYGCCNAIERDAVGGLDPWSPPVGPHGTRAQCEALYEEVYCAAFAPLSDAKRSGRAAWNGAQARRCFGFVEEAAKTCDASRYLFGILDQPDCGFETLITGKVARGETCYLDAECADDDAACVPEEPTTDTQVVTSRGICEGPPLAGEPCPGGVCAIGAFCDASGASPVCKALLPDGGSCTEAAQCQSGLCGASGSCDPKKADGESCFADAECENGLCDAGVNPAVCTSRRANGKPCTYGEQCASTFCAADGTCQDFSAAGDVIYALCEG